MKVNYSYLKWKKRYWFVVAILVGYLLELFSFWEFTIDDAYITARYALNAARGHGFVFNIGERVMGYTSVLSVLIETMVYRLGGDGILWTKILGSISGIGILGLTIRLGDVVYDSALCNVGLLAAGFLAFYPYLSLSAVMGLETNVFVVFLLLAVLLFVTREKMVQRIWRRQTAIAIVLFLATLTRPEGLGFAVLLLGFQLVALIRSSKTPHRHLIRVLLRNWRSWGWFVLYGLLVLPTLIVLWLYYGTPIPNTFLAKTSGSFSIQEYFSGITYVSRWFGTVGLISIVASLWPFVTGETQRQQVLLWILCIFFVGYVIYAGGDWMPGYRFLLPVMPFYFLLVSDGLLRIFKILAGNLLDLSQFSRSILAILSFGALFSSGFAQYSVGIRNLVSERGLGYQQAHWYIGQWFYEHTSPEASVALMDIGIIGFVSERPIIDIAGLTNVEVAQLMHNDTGSFISTTLGAQRVAKLVLAQEPDYVVLAHNNPSPDPFQGWPHDAAIYASPTFQNEYRYLFTRCHQQDYYLSVYERLGEWHPAAAVDND